MAELSHSVTSIRSEYARERQGLRAGFASRATANLIDLGIVATIYVIGLVAVGVGRYLLSNEPYALPDPGATVTVIIEYGIAGVYLLTAYLGTGRTVGKQIMGLRVVSTRGNRLRIPAALVRTAIVVPFGWISLAWSIVSHKNAALHDIAARTAVLYDWTRE